MQLTDKIREALTHELALGYKSKFRLRGLAVVSVKDLSPRETNIFFKIKRGLQWRWTTEHAVLYVVDTHFTICVSPWEEIS